RMLFGGLIAWSYPRLTAASVEGRNRVEQFLGSNPVRPAFIERRCYRIHASVIFFGITVAKRSDVGSGFASVETGSSEGGTVEALQFGAGSDPARARGLNRFGLMQEAVLTASRGIAASVYAGFMTSSPEDTPESAKSALNRSGGKIPCIFGEGM